MRDGAVFADSSAASGGSSAAWLMLRPGSIARRAYEPNQQTTNPQPDSPCRDEMRVGDGYLRWWWLRRPDPRDRVRRPGHAVGSCGQGGAPDSSFRGAAVETAAAADLPPVVPGSPAGGSS